MLVLDGVFLAGTSPLVFRRITALTGWELQALVELAWFGKLQPEIVEHLVDVRCMLTFRRDPGPALMQTPDGSRTETIAPSGNRRRR